MYEVKWAIQVPGVSDRKETFYVYEDIRTKEPFYEYEDIQPTGKWKLTERISSFPRLPAFITSGNGEIIRIDNSKKTMHLEMAYTLVKKVYKRKLVWDWDWGWPIRWEYWLKTISKKEKVEWFREDQVEYEYFWEGEVQECVK